jgi:hypothetical protein
MANRKVTVVNPAGYQEQLPDTDNLVLAALPTELLHAVNKEYVDSRVDNIDLTEIEAQLDELEQDIEAINSRLITIEGDIADIELNYATKIYVDTQDQAIADDLAQEILDREAGDQTLQDQIDALNTDKTDPQTLQEVTDLGNTTTNDMTSTGTITAAVLVGDIDQGEYAT